MPNIVQISDFSKEPRKIPAAVSESAGVTGNVDLTNIILTVEKNLLLSLLGETQYAALQLELAKLPFNTAAGISAGDQYIVLVQGNSLTTWGGLHSLLLDYIYCIWLQTTEVSILMTGAGKGKTDGYEIADNSSKYTQRWNSFVDAISCLREHLEDEDAFSLPEDFPCFEYQNSLGL